MTINFDIETVPERDRERVAAMIPDPRIAKGYVHREIDGVADFDWFDMAIEEGENVLLVGPTGSAKTTAFRAYAAARGLPINIVECNGGTDPKTEVGALDPTTLEWVDGNMTLILRYGGVNVWDECNMMHQRLAASFHGALSVMRRLANPDNREVIHLGRGGTGDPQPVLLGGAMNPTSYHGTTRVNQAFANRFAVTLDWDYEREVESQLIASETLLDVAYGIRALAEVRSPLSTNALMEFERHYYRLGIDAAVGAFVRRFDTDDRQAVRNAVDGKSTFIVAELDEAAAAA